MYFVARKRSKISEPIKTVRKPSARWNHRTTLPQSALAGCQLPQRGSRVGGVPFNVPLGNRKVAGDFHRPYETLMILAYTIQRTTLPQSALAGCQLPRRGSRDARLYHSTGYSPESGGGGRFSSPLWKLRGFDILPFIRPLSPGWVTDSRISLRPWCPASGSVLRKVRQTALPRLRDTHSLPSHSGSGSRHRPPARALQRPAASLQTH